MLAGLASQENDPVTDDDDDDDDDDYNDEAMINNGTRLPQLLVWHIR